MRKKPNQKIFLLKKIRISSKKQGFMKVYGKMKKTKDFMLKKLNFQLKMNLKRLALHLTKIQKFL